MTAATTKTEVSEADFQNRPDWLAIEASLEADENPPNLKMAERPDWTLFRTVEGLAQKAGVPTGRLRRLALKELADNALDAGAQVKVGANDDGCYFIEDDGPGLDGAPEEIASLFSIGRPLRSSKLLRLPQRGALGNGLRVVAGSVLASGGSLAVITRNQRIELRPGTDGSTTVIAVTAAERPAGTRIEIDFGPALPRDGNALDWARDAVRTAQGESYAGKSSAFWYDAVQFHELILAHGAQPLRALIANFDSCTGGKAGEIVTAAGLDRMMCASVTREQATTLLKVARKHTRPVSPERLGAVGRDAFDERFHYAIERGSTVFGSAEPRASIPFAVEAWVKQERGPGSEEINESGCIHIAMFVNRTPVTGEINAYRRSDRKIVLYGCGLSHVLKDGPTKGAYEIHANVLTPYCPITSDGKAPDLAPFVGEIANAIMKALKKAQRAVPKEQRRSQKDVVLENLDEAIANASGDGEFRFNERQIYYQLREIVRQETGHPLSIGNFKAILTDYENEYGEIPGMYREPRGSIYHPHRGDDIPLGTLTVEEYERPIWTFNKLVYIEKEGFSEALKDSGWPERHDSALMSSKGFTTRAARDLVDKLAEHDEPCTIFCVHDADAFGTMIYQTFQEETKARGARKIQIVNLGLEPWEAVGAGLEVEEVELGNKRKPVADYVLERADGEYWDAWLQLHRVELNAMTTPRFIAWLDHKMEQHGDGKLIPPADVIRHEFERRLEAQLRESITERILQAADLDGQVRKALIAIERPTDAAFITGIKKMFNREREREWRDRLDEIVAALTRKITGPAP